METQVNMFFKKIKKNTLMIQYNTVNQAQLLIF